MSDLTRSEAIQWCRKNFCDLSDRRTLVFPPPSGWMWAESNSGFVLEPIFTITDQGSAITSVDVMMSNKPSGAEVDA